MARPRREIDPQELEKLCGLHCTQKDLANWFGVTQQTIENRIADTETKYQLNGEEMTFREIMDLGYTKGMVSLRRRQFEAADKGNATMLIWLGKQLLGQRDNLDSRITGAKDGPIDVAVSVREELAGILDRIASRSQTEVS